MCKRVLVMGLGRFGGGVGAARFIADKGASVLVTDLADEATLAPSLDQLRDLIDAGAITLRLGGHDERDFAQADLVVVSPAVAKPWDNRFVRRAREHGAEITTEIALLIERLPDRSRVIGATGTAGKSTTAAMIAHALERTRGVAQDARVFLGGNIGGSLLASLRRITPGDWVVLELSSAQLHWLGQLQPDGAFPPRVAVATNLAPNHVDWHGSFEHYAQSKAVIAASQDSGDSLILGPGVAQQPAFMSRLEHAQAALDRIVDPVAREPPLLIPGAHNRLNAAIALRAVERALGLDADALDASVLANFPGLPHRLRVVATAGRGGDAIRAINDSKSTTPEATALAIAAFDEPGEVGAGRVRLICGGYDKGVDLTPMIAPAARCAGAYTIGSTGPAIAEAVNAAGGRALHCGGLEAAVVQAMGDINPGEVLLLSPGCASWDQFRDFEARGEAFAGLARACLQKSSEQT